MLRTICFTSVVALALVCSAPVQALQDDAPLTVTAQPVTLFPDDPGRQRVGALRYTGGVVLSAEDARFGGWSALDVQPSETGLRLIALSDRGHLAFGALALNDAGAPVGLTFERVDALTGPDGAPLRDTDRDAEGLAVLPDGQLAISFERDHRIWRYAVNGPLSPAALIVPPDADQMRSNAGLEGLASAPDALWTATEYPVAEQDHYTLWRYDHTDPGQAPHRYQIAATPDFGLTSLDADGAGGLYLLQRFWRRGVGNRIQIQHLSAEQLAQDAAEQPLTPTLLATLNPGMSVDNFEGLSAVEVDGETRLFLISDDNFNGRQRTLLLSFALDPRD